MWYQLRRHPVPMRTRFGHSLMLTYAFAPTVLAPLLPPGLALDTYRCPDGREYGFVAVGVLSAGKLRPARVPAAAGRDHLLTGYRILTRFPTPTGRAMRGLLILRSDADRYSMVLGGNLLTSYHYHRARIALAVGHGRLTATVDSHDHRADLTVVADLDTPPDAPPPGSPFATLAAARRFAGPLPYTFHYEPQTGSIVVVKAKRQHWVPQPVPVRVARISFFDQPPFAAAQPVLANAFHVADVDYGWERGSRRALDGALR